MTRMTAVQAAVRVLEKEGVSVAFGVPGAAINPLYAAMREHGGIRHILARHVEGASHMADGYTRAVAGNIGVCLGTSGPAGTDMITGLYAAIGILAALHHRKETGKGQHVDLALLDVTLAGMTNLAQYYLTSGVPAQRYGNTHSTIVPYQAFATSNGHIVIAVGNDTQFRRLCGLLKTGWADDSRFATNTARVKHRGMLIPELSRLIAARTCAEWVDLFRAADIPAGPVNTMDQVFATEQVRAREMKIVLPHPLSPAPVDLVGSPLKLSETPVSYRAAPPMAGQHTADILKELLGLDASAMKALKASGAIA